jgi:phosphopantothenoylcysteine synthetase/decarboxylase
VGLPGTGFESDTNEIILLGAHGDRHSLGPCPKSDLANELLDVLKLESRLNDRSV